MDFDALAWPEALTPTAMLPFWKQIGFDPSAQPLLLGVSGGADSMAMLHFFARENLCPQPLKLSVAHVQHGLRSDAHLDARLVQAVCETYRVPYQERVLQPKTRRPRESTEAWARRERYRALHEIADTSNIPWVLTAHHRDDFVETQTLRLERGEGWKGLQGLPWVRAVDGFSRQKVIRPFLPLPGLALREYLQQIQATWCEDSTNQNVRFTRNRLRWVDLPRWEREWQTRTQTLPTSYPNFRDRLFRVGWQLQQLADKIEALEALSLPKQKQIDRNHVEIEGKAFEALLAENDLNLVAQILRQAVSTLGGPPDLPRLRLCRALYSKFLESRRDVLSPQEIPPLVFDLGRDFCFQALKKGDEMGLTYGVFHKKKTRLSDKNAGLLPKGVPLGPKTGETSSIKVILGRASGEVNFQQGERQWCMSYRFFAKPSDLDFPAPQAMRAVIAVPGMSTLEIRTRQPGDRFSPLGLQSQSRKLKAFLNERKVPTDLRDHLPLVFIEGLLAWVPGYGISDSFKVTTSHETLLELGLRCLTP